MHDLALAACTLARGGLMLIDDLHNPAWPGVQEGCPGSPSAERVVF